MRLRRREAWQSARFEKERAHDAYLLLQRIAANLSQPELAQKADVTERKVKAWEYDKVLPTESEWRVLEAILSFKNMTLSLKPTFESDTEFYTAGIRELRPWVI